MNYIYARFLFCLIAFTLLGNHVKGQSQSATDSIYKSITLNEVSVKGHRAVVKDEGSLRTVLVKGTVLANMGNLNDILRITPGLVMKGDKSFEVIGKGTPKYYVDGKELAQQDILTTIKSNNISKIEIESEPSAKYPVGTEVVINIVTLKPIKDIIALTLGESAKFQRKFSHNPSFNFLMKKGFWTTGVDCDFLANRALNKETYFKEIYRPTTLFRTDETNRLMMKDDDISVTWGNDFQLSANHRMSFEYYYNHEYANDTNDELMSFVSDETVSYRDIYRTEKECRNLHNFSLSYSGELNDVSSLEMSADYSILHSNKYTNSLETNRTTAGTSNVLTKNGNNFNIWTINASYTTTLFDVLDTEIGARYYNTSQKTAYRTNNPSAVGNNAENQQELSDEVTAVYLTLKRKWKKVTVALDGRYEYAQTQITANANDGKYSDRNYSSEFLPVFKLSYRLIKGFTVQGVYRRSVTRPGYTALNPFQVYEDSLSYNVGNKDLQPGVTDKYTIYLYWKYFTLYGGYSHTKNDIVTVDYCLNMETNQIASMPVNFGNVERYFLGLGYSRKINKVNLSATGVLGFPKCSYPFMELEQKTNKACLELGLNVYYTINKMFKAFSVFTYQSSHEHQNCYQKMANNWSVGLQASLLDDKLQLNLNVTDILHKAHYNNITRYYMNTKTGTFGTNDMRGISLSASFKLFNKELSVEASRSSDDALDRTMY